MCVQDFIIRLFDQSKHSDYGYWASFRDPHPDTLHAFRYDDGADGARQREVTVLITPDVIRIGKYPGDIQPATFTRDKAWDALGYIEMLLVKKGDGDH